MSMHLEFPKQKTVDPEVADALISVFGGESLEEYQARQLDEIFGKATPVSTFVFIGTEAGRAGLIREFEAGSILTKDKKAYVLEKLRQLCCVASPEEVGIVRGKCLVVFTGELSDESALKIYKAICVATNWSLVYEWPNGPTKNLARLAEHAMTRKKS